MGRPCLACHLVASAPSLHLRSASTSPATRPFGVTGLGAPVSYAELRLWGVFYSSVLTARQSRLKPHQLAPSFQTTRANCRKIEPPAPILR